jgi:hypothetical protein
MRANGRGFVMVRDLIVQFVGALNSNEPFNGIEDMAGPSLLPIERLADFTGLFSLLRRAARCSRRLGCCKPECARSRAASTPFFKILRNNEDVGVTGGLCSCCS